MEPISPDKVVWLDALERNGRVTRRDEPIAFLGECRDYVIGQITASLHGVLEKIEAATFELADRSDVSELRSQLLDAHDKFGSRRALVVFGFRRSYLAAWDQSLPARGTNQVVAPAALDAGLSLVDNDSLEESIAVGKLSAGLERNCEEQLFKLSARVGDLLGDPALDNGRNPLRPRLLAESLHAALADLGLGSRAKVVVLGLLEPLLREDLSKIYNAVEQRMARRQGNLDAGGQARRQTRKTFSPNRRDSQDDLYGTLARLVAEVRGDKQDAGGAEAAPAGVPAGLLLQAGVPLVQGGPGMPGGFALPVAGGAVTSGVAAGTGLPVGTGLAFAGTLPATGPASQGPFAPGTQQPVNGAAAGAVPAGAVAGASVLGYAAGAPAEGAPVLGAPAGGGLPPGSGTGAGMPLPAAGIGAVSGFAHGTPPTAANSAVLLTSLTALQRGDMSAFGAVALLSPNDFEAGSGNILHALRRTPLAREFPANDAITFDIVAMLFDFIFEDEDIPELMKARIGRLQVPVVKVALLDKAFFSSRQHPARQLIDLLAEAAQSWVPEGFNNDRLLTEVDAVVQAVLDHFEADVTVFAEGVTRLTVYLEGERARERELAQASAHVVLARERREIGLNVARDAIETRLADRDVPPAVSGFLRQHWTEVMASLYLRHGETSPEWTAGLATLDELLWSVEPKLSSPERNQLVARLPQLLRRLQSGMDLAEVVPAERNAFFTGLVACHASAVKMGLRSVQRDGDTPVRRAAAEAPPTAAESSLGHTVASGLDAEGAPAPLLLKRVEENGIQLEEIRLKGERGTRAALAGEQDEYGRLVRELKRGACVEFSSLDGQRTRCKLAWVSPLRGIYLFTRQPGRQALSVSPEALAAALRSGEATLLNDAPLFDRAVDSLLGALAPA